jgi:uncharacterized membrane protein YeaQ/YmgE (transglycosylase-associated protein family)
MEHGIIAWLVIGAIAGFLAGKIVEGGRNIGVCSWAAGDAGSRVGLGPLGFQRCTPLVQVV